MKNIDRLHSHVNTRERLRDFFAREGVLWVTAGSVMPPQELAATYSTVFMGALREDKHWIYHGEAKGKSGLEAGTSWCVRSDSAFMKAGKSPRHLTSFEMFGVDGVADDSNAVSTIYRGLASILPRCHLHLVLHPAHTSIIKWADSNQVKTYLSDKNVLDRKDTDRRGKRVEIVASDEEKSWELSNVVCVTHIGDEELATPIIDAGGSFERVLAMAEGVPNVFETSVWHGDKDSAQGHFPGLSATNGHYTGMDLARTICVLARSGYRVGTGSRQEQTIRKAIRAYSLWCVSQRCESAADALDFLNYMNRAGEEVSKLYLWPSRGEILAQAGIVEYLAKTFDEKIPKIKKRLQSIPQSQRAHAIAQIANTFDGGTKELVQAIYDSLE